MATIADIRSFCPCWIVCQEGIFEPWDNIIKEVFNLRIWPVLHHLFDQEEISSLVEIMNPLDNNEELVGFIRPKKFLYHIIAIVLFGGRNTQSS